MSYQKDLPNRKVLHIITGLHIGGAEMMLLKVIRALINEFEFSVICLGPSGPLMKELQSLNVQVECFNLPATLKASLAIPKLARKIKSVKPDVVSTWMYHSDLLGGIAAKIAGVKKVIWGVRHSDFTVKGLKTSTKVIIRLNALLSHFVPDKIVFNSSLSCRMHGEIGYCKNKSLVISNGFETDRFVFSIDDRARIKTECDIPLHSKVIGFIARFDPLKNHLGFFVAANKILSELNDVYFLLSGRNIDQNNKFIVDLVQTSIAPNRFILLGERHDVPAIMSAVDVLVLTSTSESFPNVIGEAMAIGVPCVSTDVGAAKEIIGDTGFVVAPSNMEQLAERVIAMLSISENEQESLRKRTRERIIECFSLERVSQEFKFLFKS